ncbi:hypothetical protein CMK21_09130 [Candidatus Poribacteria bacterium]|nr:hypothetical protein [Candidatus Poribacteria bacterium]
MPPAVKFSAFLRFQHWASKPTNSMEMSPANTSQKTCQFNASAKNRWKAQITDSQIMLPVVRLIQVTKALLLETKERSAK